MVMSAHISGDIPALDTQAAINQVAIEWLPIATGDYQRITQMILDGSVRAELRSIAAGQLEIALWGEVQPLINRDDLSPEERVIYDASYVGAVDRLDRAWVNVKQAIFDALPPIIQRAIIALRGWT